MPSRFVAVAYDAFEPAAVAGFWAALLGMEVVIETDGALVPGDDLQVGLRFVAGASDRTSRDRLHLHVTSTSLDDQRHTVETALRLGGRHLDVGQDPDDEHVVLADPEGNEFDVIEPGNVYLAGTGYLGEVTCQGSREVGMFWRDALAWPLVWDEGAQTAVQSPMGGTKISWDAPPPQPGRSRQRFDLEASDVTAEADRLVSLGATRLGDVGGGIELADPDGIVFRLTQPT